MNRTVLITLVCWSFMSNGVVAQGLPDMSELAAQVSESRAENALKMRDYTWKRRTEVAKDGEPQVTRLELVRFDFDGRMQTTLISEQKPEQRRMRGIRGRIQQRAGEARKEWLGELQALLQKYSLSSTRQVRGFLQKATFGRGDRPGTLRILGTNVVKQGDELTMIVDADTKELRTTRIRTMLDGDVVLMETNHDRLASGLNYQARTVIRVPNKKIRMTVENFDYDT